VLERRCYKHNIKPQVTREVLCIKYTCTQNNGVQHLTKMLYRGFSSNQVINIHRLSVDW